MITLALNAIMWIYVNENVTNSGVSDVWVGTSKIVVRFQVEINITENL